MTMQRYECQDVQAVLSGLLDGELDAAASHLAEAHLAQCSPCREVLQKAEETDDLLRATLTGHEAWPAALERRIRAEVFGVVDGAEAGHRRRRLLFAAWSGWSIAAVVMLGFGVTLSQGRFNTTPMESPAGALATGEGAESLVVPEAVAWVPPVGSEELARSIIEGGLRLIEDEPSLSDPESGTSREALAMETEAAPVLPAAPERRVEPGRSSFNELALTGVEAEIETSRQLDQWAASLPNPTLGSMPTDDPEPITEEVATLLASNEEVDPADARTGEVLHQASILLTVLEQAGQGSFSDVRMVQQALSSDDVLERLAVARGDLDSPGSIDLVNRAWTVLEWTTGSVDQDELERVKQSIAMQDLPGQLERLRDQYWN